MWTSALRGLPLRGEAASLPLLRARWLRAAPPALRMQMRHWMQRNPATTDAAELGDRLEPTEEEATELDDSAAGFDIV